MKNQQKDPADATQDDYLCGEGWAVGGDEEAHEQTMATSSLAAENTSEIEEKGEALLIQPV